MNRIGRKKKKHKEIGVSNILHTPTFLVYSGDFKKIKNL